MSRSSVIVTLTQVIHHAWTNDVAALSSTPDDRLEGCLTTISPLDTPLHKQNARKCTIRARPSPHTCACCSLDPTNSSYMHVSPAMPISEL